jgi:hypothetical protein
MTSSSNPKLPPDVPQKWVDLDRLCDWFEEQTGERFHRDTIRGWIRKGVGPPPTYMGRRPVFYLPDAFEWLLARKRGKPVHDHTHGRKRNCA